MTSLTLSEAEVILGTAKAKVWELGVKMSVSVVDPRGDLITMLRTDGASWRTPPISREKAKATACFFQSGAVLSDRAELPVFRALHGHGGRT